MLKPLLDLRVSSVIFISFTIFVGIVGYLIGSLPPTPDISGKATIVYPFLLSLILVGVAYLNYLINAQIEEESQIKIDKNEERCEKRVKSYIINCFDALGRVERRLKKNNLQDYEELLAPIYEVKAKFQRQLDNYNAAQIMVNFLDDRRRRKIFIEQIFSKFESKYFKEKSDDEITSVVSEYETFRKDINKCINWLRNSLDHLDHLPIEDKTYLTTALTSALTSEKRGDEFNIYEYVLREALITSLEDKRTYSGREFKNLCVEADVSEIQVIELVEEYVNYLLKELKPIY